jgi:uncharacterized protein YbaA (DUF1428 family)
MATYVDGFVFVVPKKKTAEYKKLAREAAKVWRTFGALEYKECIGEDVQPNTGGMPMLGFAKLTKLKPSEAVWFSFIVYKSRKHRDDVNKKVMAYFSKKYGDKPMNMPFDMKRFSYGGFAVEVEA